ncbi:MAG: glycosyltransferase family 4 protein [Prevotella sp.]|nr:glycosyltransferase family 4 protein [Prevotella sp.]
MKKIVYIVGGLYQPSGMGQVLSCKVNYLAGHTEWQIFVVLTERPDLPFFYKLADNIQFVNFDINFDELDTMPLLKKIREYHKKQSVYKKKLTSYLMEVRPDITVTAIRREINFINDIPDGSKKIGEIHFEKHFYRHFYKSYLPGFVNKWITGRWQGAMIKQLARLDKFVILTEEDARNWNMLSNKIVIPNPLTKYPDVHSSQKSKTVISVGRYDPVKGFDMLIDAWSIVAPKHPDWNLRIVGPGNKTPYQEQVKRLRFEESINCREASDQIYDEMAEASFYVLSSRSEGFGLVLIEAMAVGLPCVAFSCSPGPRSIISHQRNGILVEKDNVHELANAICYMIENDDERQKYAEQAIIDSEQYSVENIMQKWITLFETVM